MRINHNIAALNTYRQLGNANNAQQASMEKLSSGLRINGAKDDAAGLAISEKMRAQVRGLDQASANAQDANSMIQTAEGALSETTDILQRMRELATQAANDTNTDTDRGEIQKEINQLTSEINRIGNTTEFNTQKLLDGGVKATGAIDSITNTVYDPGATIGSIGSVNSTVGQAAEAAVWNTGAITPLGDDSSGTFEFNGVTITVNTDSGGPVAANVTGDGAVEITIANSADADAMATAIKDAVTAYKLDGGGVTSGQLDNFNFGGDGSGLTITGTTTDGDTNNAKVITGTIGIENNGVQTPGVSEQIGSTTFEITSQLGTGDTLEVAGVTFEVTADGTGAQAGNIGISAADTLEDQAAAIRTHFNDNVAGLTAAAGSDGTITINQDAAGTGDVSEASLSGSAPTAGEVGFEITTALGEGDTLEIGGTTFEVTADGTGAATGNVGIDLSTLDTKEEQAGFIRAHFDTGGAGAGTFNVTGSGASINLEQSTPGTGDIADPELNGPSGGEGFSASFQIGANAGQSMTIEIRDMRATSDALRIASVDGTTVDSLKTGKTAYYTEATDVTNGTDNTGTFKSLDVSSHEKASAAIDVINDAIESVSAERSKLGAYQNRLDHTINNLGTSSENLTAAESRIRDVDYALAV